MLKRVLILLVLAFSASQLFAQVTTSSLAGRVTNNAGQNLAGATITAVHQPTGTKYSAISQSDGHFYIADMRPGGPYHIEVSYVGSETQKFDDVYLKLAEPFYLNPAMVTKGTVLENVLISTTRRNPILNSRRTGAQTNLNRAQIERMPSITRSVNDLTRVTPQSNGPSVAGGNYRQNNFTIDGSDFNNSFGISSGGGGNIPGGGAPISLDAIDEISVSISPFDVRQSGFIGSAINAVTRSGTNNYYGSVYQFWRNEKQQGDQVGKITFTRPAFNFKLVGVSLGGPIIKNKLFFFFNYETERQPQPVQSRFAATAAAPFGSSPNIARPTADSLNIISQYLQKTYGYETGAFDNYIPEIKRKRYLGRLDWNINQKNHFMIRYSQIEGSVPSTPSTSTSGSNWPGYPSGGGRTDNNNLWAQNSNYYQGLNFYSGAAELTSKIGKHLSNILRGTYTYQNEVRTTTSTPFPFVDILSGGTPYTSFGYELFSWGNLRKVKMHSFVDNLTFSKGKHTATAGVQSDISTTVNGFQRFGTSFYIFNSWNDFISGAKPVNFALTFSFLPGFAQAFPSFKFAQFSAYAQDEIAVNKNFRLTIGFRADRPKYKDVDEIVTNPYILAVNFANGLKVNTGILPKRTVMISPRIGFNYDLYGDRSLQIRGGTGLFTGKIPFVWIVSQSGDNGMLQTTQGFNGTANTPGPFNPDPAAYRPATIPDRGSVIPTTIEVLAKNYKFPQTWKSSLGVDAKLPLNMILTVEGIFNKDTKTPLFNNVNLVAPSPLGVAGYPDNRLIYPNATNLKFINPVMATPAQNKSVFVANGTVAPAGSSIQAANVIEMRNGRKGYYASLSFQLQRPFSKGFLASISYTKSVASNLFDGSGDQPLSAWQGTATSTGPNDPQLGYASFVVPDRVTASLSYRHEYFKHAATTISAFYNGGIDYRFSYVYGADFNRDGFNGNDLIYIPKNPSEIVFDPIGSTINPSVSLTSPSGTYNNGIAYSAQQQSDLFFAYISQDKYLRNHMGQYAERNGAQAPWRNQVDIRLMQDLFVNVVKQKNTIQFTLDIFNFGNFINSNWGKVKTINASAILIPTNQASLTPGGTLVPHFHLAGDRGHPVTDTFRDNVSTASTYYMQFGLRYIFGN